MSVVVSDFIFTSDTTRQITIDSSTYPDCIVNDGGTVSTVPFSSLSLYIVNSDGDFYIFDLSVNLRFIGYPDLHVYPNDGSYVPLSALPDGFTYEGGVLTLPSSDSSSVPDSLNGNFGTFPDGTNLIYLDTNIVYSVVRSYFVFASKSTCTPMYELLSPEGLKHFAPHDALSLVS